jgi:hypothetical protein
MKNADRQVEMRTHPKHVAGERPKSFQTDKNAVYKQADNNRHEI